MLFVHKFQVDLINESLSWYVTILPEPSGFHKSILFKDPFRSDVRFHDCRVQLPEVQVAECIPDGKGNCLSSESPVPELLLYGLGDIGIPVTAIHGMQADQSR